MPDARPPLLDVRLVDGPVSFTAIDPFPHDAGGESVFLGRTRRESHPEHGELQCLRYEAHASMALRQLETLAREAIDRHDCLAVRVHHAIGAVPCGAASVLVQVACGHRAESFTACRFLIDALKSRVPIWKCEEWTAGTTWSEGTPVAPAQEPST